MATARVFVSFDYDHDARLKDAFIGQSRLPDSPFEVADWSIKLASATWRTEARHRIRAVDVVVVICGQRTHEAEGVATEVVIAQEEDIPYFLLWGYSDRACSKPTTARVGDKIYDWNWTDLKVLIGGGR